MNALKVRRFIDYEVSGLEERIKQARKQSPLSVTNLASDAGMSVANWYRIESGNVESLPESTLRAMESALGVDLGVRFE